MTSSSDSTSGSSSGGNGSNVGDSSLVDRVTWALGHGRLATVANRFATSGKSHIFNSRLGNYLLNKLYDNNLVTKTTRPSDWQIGQQIRRGSWLYGALRPTMIYRPYCATKSVPTLGPVEKLDAEKGTYRLPHTKFSIGQWDLQKDVMKLFENQGLPSTMVTLPSTVEPNQGDFVFSNKTASSFATLDLLRDQRHEYRLRTYKGCLLRKAATK